MVRISVDPVCLLFPARRDYPGLCAGNALTRNLSVWAISLRGYLSERGNEGRGPGPTPRTAPRALVLRDSFRSPA